LDPIALIGNTHDQQAAWPNPSVYMTKHGKIVCHMFHHLIQQHNIELMPWIIRKKIRLNNAGAGGPAAGTLHPHRVVVTAEPLDARQILEPP
jgi:hypothetical protein